MSKGWYGPGLSAGRRSIRLGLPVALVALTLGGILEPPAPRAADWNVQRLPFAPRFEGDTEPGPLFGVSCPTASACVAGGAASHLAASEKPNAGSGSWRLFSAPPGSDVSNIPIPGEPELPGPAPIVRSISCPTPSLCVAVSENGDIYTSAAPLTGAAAWSRADIDGDDYDTHLKGVSCPTAEFCVAVSGGKKQHANPLTSGKILFSHDPTGGGSAWSQVQLDPSWDLRGISCSSASFCLAVGEGGLMVASNNPDGGAGSWRSLGAPGGPGNLQGVACLHGLCVTGNSGGNLLTSVDADSPSPTWVERDGGGSIPITGVSCVSTSLCMAVDNNGDVITSRNPTGPAAAWQLENVLPYVPTVGYEPTLNAMFGVSCPTEGFCAISAAGGTVVTSVDPFAIAAAPTTAKKGSKKPKRPRTILAKVDRSVNRRTSKARIRVHFRFYAVGGSRGFVCKRDRDPWRRCHSPDRYWVTRGKHVFRVRAIGYTGLRGPIALDRFTIHSIDDKCPCARPLPSER
jgi:hypothetical protein